MANSIIKCKACGEVLNLSDLFCSKCGYELHIYPNSISKEVEEYEKQRLENWKNQMSKIASQNKNDSLVESLKSKNMELEKLVEENSKKISLLSRNQEEIKGYYDSEVTAHQKTKDQLTKVQIELEVLKAVSQQTPQKSTTISQPQGLVNRGGVRGELAYMCNGVAKKLNVYSGENLFSSPQDIELPIQGNIFKISEREGDYVLFDLCGNTKKANGKLVRLRGDNIFDGDIFSVFDIDIEFNVKE